MPKYIGQNPNGPNPFKSVVLPPTDGEGDQDSDTSADPAIAVPPPTSVTTQAPRSFREPVYGPSRRPPSPTTGNSRSSDGDFVPASPVTPRTVTTEQARSTTPIDPRNSKPPKHSDTVPAEAVTPDTGQERGEGSIRIWMGEGGGSTARPTATQPTPQTSSGPSADQLRSHARSLANQGRSAEAAAAYDQAIGAYQKQIEQHPELKAATEATIGACEAEREQLQGGGH